MALNVVGSDSYCFGGVVRNYEHESSTTNCLMKVAVFLPPQALNNENAKLPVLYYLSGLTCNTQNFITKAGAQRKASEFNIILVCPDTSPRDCNIEGEDEHWSFGLGAGYYVDATTDKYKKNYNMYSYVTDELISLVNGNLPADPERQSIMGHSMGGHGSIMCGLKNPNLYKSISAFSPICNPMNCEWGQNAFTKFLGEDQENWKQYDSCELLKSLKDSGKEYNILIHQGLGDNFLDSLQHDNLIAAAEGCDNYKIDLRLQENYDHGYYFIATFIDDHIDFHSKFLL
eukprot:TRINITY_DN1240_c0_g1_i1.p1 TRINITY_DN1240_c0_g1~~TRINITY_DN1240_c0_g1_i1.p1  ORF type:complete len:287 (-),score=92.31 TRINITY_DN1240_c0_g1_i1:89-949(-)